jgi:MFS family permease
MALPAVGVASLAGLFYYGYSPFSLVAGAAMDRLGARVVIPAGAFMAGTGALLFATGDLTAANIGRFLQGAGGVFALVGAVYIATKSFAASSAATLIGATQMFGMAGGAAGQFFVGPVIGAGIRWNGFWFAMGVIGLLIAGVLFVLIPRDPIQARQEDWISGAVKAFAVVFKNPQSILCGLIAGLLFIPTTIFDMIWGVRFLQESHGFSYGEAVMRSATVPVGWIIGSPLMGFISDRIGRRKPVMVAGAFTLLACLRGSSSDRAASYLPMFSACWRVWLRGLQ